MMCVYCLRESKTLKTCDFCSNTLTTSLDNDIKEYGNSDGYQNLGQVDTELTDLYRIPFTMSQIDGCVDSNCEIYYDTSNTTPPSIEPAPPCIVDSFGPKMNEPSPPASTMSDSPCNAEGSSIINSDVPVSALSVSSPAGPKIGSPEDGSCTVISHISNSKLSTAPSTKADSDDVIDNNKLQNKQQTSSQSQKSLDQFSENPVIVIAPIHNADISDQPQVMNSVSTDFVGLKRQIWPDAAQSMPSRSLTVDNNAADESAVCLNGSQVHIGLHKLTANASVLLTPNRFRIMHEGVCALSVAADKVISCLACLDTSFPAFFFLVEPSCFKHIRETCYVSATAFNSMSAVVNTRCITVIPQRLTPEDVIAILRCFNTSDGSYFPQVLLPIDPIEAIDILHGDKPAAVQQNGTRPEDVDNSKNSTTNGLLSSVNCYDDWMQQQLAHERRKRVREEGWRKRKLKDHQKKQFQNAHDQQQKSQQVEDLQKLERAHRQPKYQLGQLSKREHQELVEHTNVQCILLSQQKELKRQEDQLKLGAQQQMQMLLHLQQLMAEHQSVQQQIEELLQQPLSQQLQFVVHQLITQQKILQHQILQQQILQQQLQLQQQQTQKQHQLSVEQNLRHEYAQRQLQQQQIGQREKQKKREQQRQQQKHKQYISQQLVQPAPSIPACIPTPSTTIIPYTQNTFVNINLGYY